jgi:amino acid adenylation domain-containing protein
MSARPIYPNPQERRSKTKISSKPEQRLSEVPLLNVAKQAPPLVEGNNAHSHPNPVQQLFEAQVARTPDAIAAVFENQQLTYQQLNQRANQLAQHLQKLGVKPEVLVGICIERSLDLVVGLLGILKAGGAYVPLDPTYPQERLAFMLEDAQVSVLLTQQVLVEKLEQLPGSKKRALVCLDSDGEKIAAQGKENLIHLVTSDNLAYVIYTSGSTGKPKGVQIAHRSLSNLLHSMQISLEITESEAFLAVTTISFDIAALELYLPLIAGAKLIIVRHEIASDGNKLLDELNKYQATIVQATPATWQMLISCGLLANRSLKICCGGEALTRRLAQQLLNIGGTVWNLYGPTETTIWSMAHRIDRLDEVESGLAPIGKAIANTETYILDSSLQPVPVYTPGELHIGGIGLARGYLNRPELTAEKFIPHPFRKGPSARLYKTGDLARYLPNGNIEFLGRLDHQVKIRGFRIELGEIEAALGEYPAVRESVVIAQEDSTGSKRLVAYVVPGQEHIPEVNDLKKFLQQSLPEHMVPSFFVLLEALPLTPNRKVDRSALLAPAWERAAEQFVAPSTPLEELLANIWIEVLGLEQVGIHDNFFELGGNSLLGAQMFAAVKKVFNVTVPLASLYEGPTVEKLAEILLEQEWSTPYNSLIPLQPNGSMPPLFAIHYFNYGPLANHLGEDQPIYGLHYGIATKTTESDSTLPSRLEDLAAHYLQEMQAIHPQGPYRLMGFSFGGVIAFEVAQQLVAKGEKVDLLVLFDTFAPGLEPLPLFQQSLRSKHLLYSVRKAGIRKTFQRAKDRVVGVFSEPQQNSSNEMYAYVPQAYGGHVILFNAIDKFSSYKFSPDLGWKKFITGELEIHDISGDHSSLLEEPHVRILASALKKCIEKVS